MLRPVFIVATTVALSVLMPASITAAEVVKCVKPGGSVIYTVPPCPAGSELEKTGIRSEPTDPDAVEARREARAEQIKSIEEREEKEREAAGKNEQEKAQREKQCAQAREALNKLNLARRVTQGEGDDRRYLSDEEIAERKREIQERVRKACSN
jgi:hypothetical protein